MTQRSEEVGLCWIKGVLIVLAGMLVTADAGCAHRAETSAIAVTDEPHGWLVIEGGSFPVNPIVAERFRALIGGVDAKVLLVPTALADSELAPDLNASVGGRELGIRNYEVLHTSRPDSGGR